MKILFISLGCDKNLVDSEMMLGMLREHGYEFTDDEEQADIVVVNTCCFINDAQEESIQVLLEMGQRRINGEIKALIAAGCLAQRYKDEIRHEIPEVDAIVGTTAIDKIVSALEHVLEGQGRDELDEVSRKPVTDQKRIVTTGGHYAYLKIAEGCDKHCTYCIIPKVRGDYRSVPMESLVREAEQLAGSGVKELILVAQETTVYGVDLYGKKSLPELLRRLCGIRGLVWIRILYCYPEEITQELIDVIKEQPKICHYLDIPIQHASDEILRRMGRRTDQAQLMDIIHSLRQQIPDICLRTTLITGFPGETDEQHKELMDFVSQMDFDRLGVFAYSPEEDTPAASFPDQIAEEVKQERRAQLMELQQDLAFSRAEGRVGERLLVMIEGKVADENAYVGRTYRDAPNVDGLIFVQTQEELMTGDLVKVCVSGSYEYDLIGEIEK
ncbi:MAG: 30S ribosomal protein S12 methylthiotransferase RimO [Lachnospiraceae bacterium]|nr:30S ribosomal protein S12 methylthiotransferase RimO [Lachnospiraceae bacterium]